MKNLFVSALLVLAMAGFTSAGFAASLLVPDTYSTIQDAVTAAVNDDEIHVTAAGTYQSNGNGVTIDNKNISIIGDVAGVVVNGKILVSGASVATLNNLKVYDCSFDGIEMASSGDLTLIDCVMDYNPGRGVLHTGTGNIVATGCTFSRQTYDGYNKGNGTAGRFTATNCTFNNNSRAGVMLEAGVGSLDFTGCTINNNNIGIYTAGSTELTTVTLTSSTLRDNSQDQMFFQRKINLIMDGCTMENTTAPGFKAGVRLDSSAVAQSGRTTLTFTGCTFTCPFAVDGSWIQHQADITINDCTFSGYASALVVVDNHHEVAMTINDTTFSPNVGSASPMIGAYEQATVDEAYATELTLNRCTLNGGSSSLISTQATELSLTNCVLKNGATQVYSDGAQAWAKLIHCTMVSDADTTSVVVVNTTSGNLVANSIISGAGAGIDVGSGSTLDNHHNLLNAAAGNLFNVTAGASTQLDVDPRFVSASNLSLQTGSPAITAGDATLGVTDDITGASRPNPVGTNPDLGAYETSNDVPVNLSNFWIDFE